jgi:hypothetical protein
MRIIGIEDFESVTRDVRSLLCRPLIRGGLRQGVNQPE